MSTMYRWLSSRACGPRLRCRLLDEYPTPRQVGPSRRGAGPRPATKDRADRRGGDDDPQALELTLDPHAPPAGVLPCHTTISALVSWSMAVVPVRADACRSTCAERALGATAQAWPGSR